MVVGPWKNQTATAQQSPIEVSVAQIIKSVNSEYGEFLKYVPKSMLSEEQLNAAREAQQKQDARVQKLREEIRRSLRVPTMDSESKNMSNGLKEYFKDSNVLDIVVKLKVMYHGRARAD